MNIRVQIRHSNVPISVVKDVSKVKASPNNLAGTIPPQRQTTTATDGFPSVLMDDTSYTMDDPRAYMGNKTVNSSGLSSKITGNAPKAKILSPRF